MTRRNGKISLAERVARHAPGAVATVEAELVPSPTELIATASTYHIKAEQAAGSAVEFARQSGEALLAAKTQVKHGEWLPLLEKEFNGSVRRAQAYMQLTKYAESAYLDSAQSIDGALKAICGPRSKRQPRPDVPAPTPDPAPQSGVDGSTTVADPPQQPLNDQPQPAVKYAVPTAHSDGADQPATPADESIPQVSAQTDQAEPTDAEQIYAAQCEKFSAWMYPTVDTLAQSDGTMLAGMYIPRPERPLNLQAIHSAIFQLRQFAAGWTARGLS
jgi:hypothetical protein